MDDIYIPKSVTSMGTCVVYAGSASEPEVKPTNPFVDVGESNWYYAPVLWAVENGITGGIGDGLFGSEYACTRARIATFLYKVYGSN